MTSFIRKCPKCNCEIRYTNKISFSNAEKKQSKCGSCRLSGENNPMYGKTGKQNPFFGKKHTDESKRKMVEGRDYSNYRTEEFREKISKLTKGENNPMYGKSFYEVWIKNYGKDIADKKMIEFKKKQSLINSGKKNNMYGKPSPINSGNGICGWYKSWFFRSLLELSYMIFVIERFNLSWENGESEKYKIPYEINGVKKNYFPDFVINNKYIVECKPKKLNLSIINQTKFEFAKKYCDDNNFIFKSRDIPKIKKEQLLTMINNGLVILTNKWKDKVK
jgi:hypothetical protein